MRREISRSWLSLTAGGAGRSGMLDVITPSAGLCARGVAGTGKDHRVHVGSAQRFVRGLAHRPAQRLDQIRLAAAIRTDHAGEARLDHEVGGFDERLETMEAKARQLHKHDSLLAGRESPCRDNTIEGNVGVANAVACTPAEARTWPRGGLRATGSGRFSQGFCWGYPSK